MVSLRRSHCHSASDTFIGRPWSRTRSRTLRRTSSSVRRSSRSTRTSPSVARRTTRDSTVAAASPKAQPLQRLHRLSAPSPSADTRPQSCPRSTSTITGSSRCSEVDSSAGQLKYPLRFPLNRTSTTKVNSFLGQRTHGKVLLLAPFEELVDLELLELAHVALERRADRPARASLADHRRDDGSAERRHLDQAARDRLGLAAFLRSETGVGAGRIDE